MTMKSSARDRAAEIEDAISALAGSAPPVTLTAPDPVHRRIRFVHAEEVTDPGSIWMPFTGELGQLNASGRTLTVGLGPIDDSNSETARRAGAIAGRELTGGAYQLEFGASAGELAAPVVDGLATGYPGEPAMQLAIAPGDAIAAGDGLLAADTVRLARRLVSAPANVLTPQQAAIWAADLAARTGLSCQTLDPQDLTEQGFGALTAIGAGSVNGPRMVRLTHQGSAGRPVVSLVGKGITFDSGGLSLKSPAAMQSMRLDVAGAATVLAVMGALARARCELTVHAVLPFAENLPGPGAARPGDVVTAWNGTEIQILDTDFEGRVILADALALAAADRPDLLVDLATLTYQAEVALGPEIGAVLARDGRAADQLLRAAAAAGEPMWRLPWAPRYLDQVRTSSGVRNHPLRDSGRALTAALFLGEFVPDTVPWVHCDMAGPAWIGDASSDGATGFGARTLLRLLADLSAEPAV
ncbi:leucyl aminopeptidase [Nakamurella panacisegetis]|uniref:Probable cytosol aminopeptidase n=1 Tax=Nakamurella panacisegetis TaxID=1090615 RepID=A0A1H0S863_9ACTN|nr:leucyl aminopeptidase family protein [Nakamurella panacisegetis]SDP37857.1 leucyl aminopeptidase [Nakamurella panacisegetis]